MQIPLHDFFNSHTDRRTLDVLTRGPLAPHLQAYAQRLYDDGYSTQFCQSQLRLLGHFNGWLARRRIAATDVDGSTVARYVRARRNTKKRRRGDAAALGRLLQMLRHGHAETASSPSTAVQIVVQQFQQSLRQERSLAEATITHYSPIVAAFLTECLPTGVFDVHRIAASDIAGFVQRQADRITTKHAGTVVTALRSFLRYLLCRGAIDRDLAACVPTIATWSLSSVPKFLPAEQIQRVVDSCDRDTARGKRDYALLLLLARLGLRAGEVVALTLDDLDWDAGVITVRGKRKRVAQMPVPGDVGAALADYIRHARPPCASRRVFIRARAPLVGFASSVAISSLVDRALTTAGVESTYRGAHLFRHSLATHMLKQGASLPEIGVLLRHRRPDTTAIYAKVDLVALRSIALPLPGGAP